MSGFALVFRAATRGRAEDPVLAGPVAFRFGPRRGLLGTEVCFNLTGEFPVLLDFVADGGSGSGRVEAMGPDVRRLGPGELAR